MSVSSDIVEGYTSSINQKKLYYRTLFMPAHIPHIRIFLSSPGDVVEERTIARQAIDSLRYDPLLRGIHVECVAWDDPNARTPMLANKTPQQAINEGLARPSECD